MNGSFTKRCQQSGGARQVPWRSWLSVLFKRCSINSGSVSNGIVEKPIEQKAKVNFTIKGVITSLLILAGGVQAQALQVELIQDLNQAPSSTDAGVREGFEYNGSLYFVANDGNTGKELYRFDGTNTVRVADINPGSGNSNPSRFIIFNNKLYFIAASSATGIELYQYDGVNVSLVKDINPQGSSSPDNFFVFNGQLFFSASDVDRRSQLYVFDGSKVVQITNNTTFHAPSALGGFNNKLYFSYDNGAIGAELYTYDGNSIELVADINPNSGSSRPGLAKVFNERLYFVANSGVRLTLYMFDGSALSQVTAPNTDNFNAGGFNGFIEFNNTRYFTATTDADGTELFSLNSDGVSASLVVDIAPGTNGSSPRNFFVFNNKLFFAAFSPSVGTELRTIDGNNQLETIDINMSSGLPSDSEPMNFVVFDNKLYFQASGGANVGTELYVYDQGGVTLVKDIYPGTFFDDFSGGEVANGSSPNNFVVFNDELLFSARTAFGTDLFAFNGSDVVQRANITGSADSSANDLTLYNNKFYFTADDGVHGRELFVYDGNSIALAADINQGEASSNPTELTIFDNKLYFQATTESHGEELWVFDGTNATLVDDLVEGALSSSPEELAVLNNKLYFRASSPDVGGEIHVFDGTKISVVQDITPGVSRIGSGSIVLGDKLYFQTSNGDSGFELFVLQNDVISLVEDIQAGTRGSGPRNFAVFGNDLVFSANDGSNGVELYILGTDGNVTLVDINTNGSSSPSNFVEFDGKLYFSADAGDKGVEFYVYDGTEVKLVTDINSNGSSSPASFTVFNGKLYFTATSSENVRELYVYDGTTTSLLRETVTGNIGTSPSQARLTVIGNQLVFNAKTDENGEELYLLDNTDTLQLVDVNPGAAGSSPSVVGSFNNNVVFAASGLGVGNELFRLSSSDSDGNLTAGTGSDTNTISTRVKTADNAVNLFDFTITDGGGGDTLSLNVSQLVVNVAGSSTDVERSALTWRLNGADATNVVGSYDRIGDTVTFSGLTISVPDGGNETYTVNAFFNDASAVTDGATFVLSVDGDTDLTTSNTRFGNTSAVTHTVTIAKNNPPTANAQSVTTDEDTAAQITLTGGDVDAGDSITYSVETNPTNGTLSGTAPNLTYTPNANFNGSDSFTFKTNDGDVDSTTATVTITVNAVEDAPVFSAITNTNTAEDAAFSLSLNATDPEGDDVTYRLKDGSPSWLQVVAQTEHQVSTFAGSGSSGSANGNGVEASFDSPSGVAVDADGNVYVGDSSNRLIRKITPSGDVTTLAGSGEFGNSNGNGTAASFSSPNGVAVDADGNIYVADTFNHLIRRITPNGDVTTLAGLALVSGGNDGNGSEARFGVPRGVAVGADGNVYVADSGIHLIRRVTSSGDVTTLAGLARASGSNNGNGSAARFDLPIGVALDTASNIYVADTSNHLIRRITPSGDVTTFAGSGSFGNINGNGTAASFESPSSVAVDATGNVYVADRGNNLIRRITPSGDVTTFAGSGSSGSNNGNASVASFDSPSGVAVDAVGNIYVADNRNHLIRRITPPGTEISGTPTNADVGNHQVCVIASDANNNETEQCFTLTVTNVNDPPTANAQSVTTDEDTAAQITLTGGDVDAGDSITYSVETNPTNGTLSGTAPNLTYTPNANFNGSDSFTFKTNDGDVDSTTATVTITVNAVEDAPVFSAIANINTAEDAPFSLSLNATDPDGDNLTYRLKDGSPSWLSLSVRTSTTALDFAQSGFNFTKAGDIAVDPQGNVYVEDVLDTNSYRILRMDADGNVNELFREDRHLDVMTVDPMGNLYIVTRIFPFGQATVHKISPDGTSKQVAANSSFSNSSAIAFLNNKLYIEQASLGPFGDIAVIDIGNNEDVSGLLPQPVDSPIVGIAFDASGRLYSINASSSTSIRQIDEQGNSTLIYSDNESDSSGLAINSRGTFYFSSLSNSGDQLRAIQVSAEGVSSDFVDVQHGDFTYHYKLVVAADDAVYLSNPADNEIRRVFPPVTVLMANPTNAEVGNHQVCVIASDGNGNEVEQCFTLTVDNVNDAPTANAQITSTDEDTAVGIVLTGSDVDAGDSLSYTVVDAPERGVLSGTAPNLTYTPSANVNGSDSFTFKVTDSQNVDSSLAVVTIAVSAVNDAPVVMPQTLNGVEDTSVSVTFAGTDAEDDSLTFAVVTPPSSGQLIGNGNTRSYVPNANFNGRDSFTYRANDGTVNSSPATVTINVASVNDAPVATSQSVSATEDTASNITLSGSDVDGDNLTYVIVAEPSNGALSGTGVNRIYTPNANFNGQDSFIFRTNDGNADSNSATVTISVASVNDVPVVNGQSISTTEDNATSITLTGIDNDNDVLTYTIVSQPANGTLTGTGANRTYTPNANFNGSDSFTYRANDGSVNSNSATITINVSSVNDAPVATDDSISVEQNSIATVIDVLANDTDIESSSLTVVSANASNGQVVINSDFSLSYTPNQDYVGSDTINYTIEDGDNANDSAEVAITVTEAVVNAAPVAVADSATVNAGESITVDVLSNDTDAENEALTLVSATTTVGSAEVANNQLRFSAASNLSGLSVVNYLMRDEAGNTAEGVLNVTINNAQGIVLNVPASLCDANAVNATGLLTRVDVGEATATDAQGRNLGVSLVDGNTLFAPGRHTVLWQTEDRDGNRQTAEQVVCVNPQVSLGLDKSVLEGEAARFTVSLNGEAPSYPVTVAYTVAGTADDADHNLQSGELTIDAGTSKVLEFQVEQDGADEGDESIVISLDSANNLGAISSQTLTITEQNIAPVARLTAQQDGQMRTTIAIDGGEVIIRSGATDSNSNDTLTYQWANAQGDQTGVLTNTSINDDIFSFSPTSLEAGLYTITLTVTDNGSPSLSDVETINLELIATLPTLTDTDSDGDGIPDNLEGLGDSDGDGIADYLDGVNGCNIQQEASGENNTFLVESPAGTCLRQGQFAMQGDTNGLRLTDGDFQTLPSDTDVENIGGIFDYVVTDLAQTGDVVAIVIPQRRPIPENAVYRKYNASQGWHDFVENATNSLWSAPGEQGQCPSPNLTPETSSANNPWTQGLTAGHWCVQMLIEDGGVNDDDNTANGTVVDPGFVGAAQNGNTAPVAQNDSAELVINTSITVDVLTNDSDADNDSLTISSATATIGTVEITTSNQLRYTPPANYTGAVTVTYGVSDGQGATTQGQLSLTIIANTPPVVANEQSQTNQGQAVTANLLTNDTDGENDALTLVAVDNQNVRFSANGQAIFTPPEDFFGVVTINYTVEDTAGNRSQGQWQVTVIQVHEPTVSSSGGGSMGILMLLTLLLLGARQVRGKQISSHRVMRQAVRQAMMMGKE